MPREERGYVDWEEGQREFEKKYGHRFFHVTPHIRVACAMVFFDEAATTAGNVPWPKSHVHEREAGKSRSGEKDLGESKKFYLFAGKQLRRETGLGYEVSFDLSVILTSMESAGVKETVTEWTFMRHNARIACSRASEYGLIWGFGRKHHFRENFKAHQLLAGPLVDYRPPTVKEGWDGFEPVFLKVQPTVYGSSGYYLKLCPEWEEQGVRMIAEEVSPSDVPEKLRNYEFPQRRPSGKAGAKAPGKRVPYYVKDQDGKKSPGVDPFDQKLFESIKRGRRR